jgi:hypothetical protein
MTSNLKSSVSAVLNPEPQVGRRGAAPHGWLKVGAVAAASAVLGGLAAAWFYRKTLSQLREAEGGVQSSDAGITEDESAEDF